MNLQHDYISHLLERNNSSMILNNSNVLNINKFAKTPKKDIKHSLNSYPDKNVKDLIKLKINNSGIDNQNSSSSPKDNDDSYELEGKKSKTSRTSVKNISYISSPKNRIDILSNK